MIGPLSGKHLEVFKEDNTKYVLLDGSVSSGKTITSLLKWVDFVLHAPPGELLMCAKTERTLLRNIINPLITIFGSAVIKKGAEVEIFGRRCYCCGASDERAEQKIRGLSLVGAYVDELTLVPESFWQMLKTRLRMPGARLIATTNPDNPMHYIKKDFIDNEKIKDKKIYHFTLDDNKYLDPKYVEDMKNSFTGLWYKRYILGLWVAGTGAIYDQFDEEIHTYDEHPVNRLGEWDYGDYYISCDYGTNNPCVFLLFGVKKDMICCIKEYYYDGRTEQEQKTDSDYADDLIEFMEDLPIKSVIIDPSALSFKVELRKRGIQCRDANNEVLDGIRVCSTLLKTGKYYIYKDCVEHIKEFYGYVWDEKAQQRGEDKPKKENDHTMDSWRYLCATVIGKEMVAVSLDALHSGSDGTDASDLKSWFKRI